ncbi:MAG: copper oxidase [Halomonadaceae bacterium]|nr:MAG: copper oxidase [Halomonadaceae bacterium]
MISKSGLALLALISIFGSVASQAEGQIAPIGSPVSDLKVEAMNPLWDFRHGYHPQTPVSQNYSHQPLPQAPVVRSDPSSGELSVTLTVDYANHQFTTLRDGQSVTESLTLRSYNGGMVGPTLEARPGDTLKIRLVNLLPPETNPPSCDHHHHGHGNCNHNAPHNFNTINLHTHGLHVDPTGNSDNIFIELDHGESFDYEIHIPEDHVAGTFWYHAHVHGATSVQTGSGLAGALIIRGDYDNIPGTRRMDEKIIMLQEIAFDDDGRIENNETYAPTAWEDQALERGWHISLNGAVMPEIHLNAGSIENWRFIHAGVRKLLNLKLLPACEKDAAIPLVQMAADGISHHSKRLSPDLGVFMAPGYRSDVAVRGVRPGVYYLVDSLESNGTASLPDSYCQAARNGSPLTMKDEAQQILAKVVVGTQLRPMLYPRNRALERLNRPAPIMDSELSPESQYVDFDIDISVSPWVGLINGRAFDPHQPRRLTLGEAQTWYLTSTFSHHPFHIHVNPFEVIQRDSKGNIIDRYWKDTINVPQTDPTDVAGSQVEIRTRYENFTGAFVFHCHILDHGDHGMMEKVIIE